MKIFIQFIFIKTVFASYSHRAILFGGQQFGVKNNGTETDSLLCINVSIDF